MKPVTSQKLPRSVARTAMHDIGLAIVRGEFAPGSTLPNEDALAARTGAGRPALREAIKVLSGKGLVRTARRYGSRVTPRTEWHFLDPDVLSWHLTDVHNWPSFLRDIVEMRQLVEPAAAALAARRATKEEVEAICDVAERLPLVSTEASIADDVVYHTTILRASHNSILAGFAPSLEVLLRAYFAAIWRIRPHGPHFEASRNLHQALAGAIQAREPKAARDTMDEMLEANARELDDVVWLFEAGLKEASASSVAHQELRRRLEDASAMFLLD